MEKETVPPLPVGARTDRVDIFDPLQDAFSLAAHLARYLFVARQVKSDNRIIEVGCGTGYGAATLSRYGSSVLGHDPYVPAGVLNAQWASFSNLSFSDSLDEAQQYDVVVSLEVIEHMERHAADTFLEKLVSLGGDHSRWYLSTPRRLPEDEKTANRKAAHPFEYSFEEFEGLLGAHFKHVHMFSQNDAFISNQSPVMAWNFFAVCTL